jgi:hypothetical protein
MHTISHTNRKDHKKKREKLYNISKKNIHTKHSFIFDLSMKEEKNMIIRMKEKVYNYH